MKTSPHPLSLGLKVGYGAYDFGNTFFILVTSFWFFIYLTDVMHLEPGLAGIAIGLVRVVEILATPFLGYFANHVQTRWGRRRPFLLFGALPAGIAFTALFWGPHLTSQAAIFMWEFTAFLVVSLLFTAMTIPYSALTVDLTPDPHQRTVLNAWRIGWATVGTLLAGAAIQPLQLLFPTALEGYRATGILFGAIIIISTLMTFFTVRESASPVDGTSREGLFFSHKMALTSKSLVSLLISWLLTMTAVTLLSAAVPYLFKHVLHRENMTSPALGICIVASILSIPLWVLISKRIGKKTSYLLGMLWFGTFSTLTSLLAPGREMSMVFVGMAAVGFGYAAVATLPWAILPDVIDEHYNATGRRHEGIAYGLWLVATKSGMLIAAGILGAVLSLTDYQPELLQHAALKEKTAIGIMALMGPIPFLMLIVSCIIMSKRNNHSAHAATGHGRIVTKQ